MNPLLGVLGVFPTQFALQNCAINRTCVAGNHGLCHGAGMVVFFRLFLAILVALTQRWLG